MAYCPTIPDRSSCSFATKKTSRIPFASRATQWMDPTMSWRSIQRSAPIQRSSTDGSESEWMAGRGLVAQPLGEQRVGEVGGGRHGAAVLVDQLGPQQRVAQEVHPL